MERTSRLRALRSANDTSPTHARVRVESEMRRITDFPTGQINDYAPLAGPSMKAVILPDGQIKKSCPALPKKIFLFSFDPNHPHIDAVSPHRGAYRDRHGRGMGCGGRGSVGAKRQSQGRLPVSERPARGRTALLLSSLKLRRTGTKPGEASWRRRVAYGKTVWSRHPLLVPSCRWRVRSNRID
jgi:hypothetical protein